MNKWSKFALLNLVICVLGCILSYFMNINILICDIYIAVMILLYNEMTKK